MKRYYLLLSLCLSNIASFAQAPIWTWAKGMGGGDGDYGYSVAVDASGNVYTTGVFVGIADFDPGPAINNLTATAGANDVFISKVDASGNFIWAKAIGGTYGDYGYSIAVDAAGNAYITGAFAGTVDFDPGTAVYNLASAGGSDIFILKLDLSGNFVWAKAMGGTGGDVGSSISLDANGNVYTTGSFNLTADFDPGAGTYNLTSAGSSDIFISKLDVSGNLVWAKAMGGTSGDYGYSIASDTYGNVYTTGSFVLTTDFDPGAGNYNLTSAGSYDIFISKLDVSGNFVWAKAIGGTGADYGRSIALDATGNVYIAGDFQSTADFDPGAGIYNLPSAGGYDIFICKVDASGNFVWAKTMGGTSMDYGRSIALDASNNVYTTGYFSGTSDFDPGAATYNLTSAGGSSADIFVTKLDVSGNFVWAKLAGGANVDNGNSIAVNSSGDVHVVGYFSPPSATFDATNLASAGLPDIFVAQIGPPCTTAPLQPGSIVGNIFPCSGSSQNYSIWAVSGATSYIWTLPGGWSGTSTTNTITTTAGATGGSITVAAANACGASALQSVIVTVPLISASITPAGPTTFCQGGSVVLNASPSGFTYWWKLNGNYIAGATTASYTATTSGNYTVEVTGSNCTSTATATTVTVHPLPTPIITQSGNLLTAPSGFSSYKWYKNGALISGATANTYTTSSSGTYYVVVTNSNNCTGQSNTLVITGIKNIIQGQDIQVYPIPFSGSFTVSTAGAGLLTITDLAGKGITEYSLKAGDNELRLSDETAPGTYLGSFKAADGKAKSFKLVYQP